MKDGVYVYRDLRSVSGYWKKLIRDNPEMTVYQSVEWNRHVRYTYRTNRYLLKTVRTRYFVVFRDGAPKVIAPLAIPNDPKEYISIQGQYTKAGALNLIYASDAEYADFDALFSFVFSQTRNEEIGLYEVPSFTKLHQYLVDREDARYLFGETCVRCGVPETYDDYYSALSKSSRQTIRTSQNRLQSDGKTLDIQFYRGKEHIPLALLPKVKRLCENRIRENDPDAPRPDPEDAKMDLRGFLFFQRNELYRYVRREDGAFCGVVRIDGQIAAVMIAAQRDGYVIVPTFSHDSRFDRYTPGVLLLNAFFQTFCGSDLRVMDLSRGNEKYKYRYLCLPEEYHADHFKIRRS